MKIENVRDEVIILIIEIILPCVTVSYNCFCLVCLLFQNPAELTCPGVSFGAQENATQIS
jgi:hypothetical protein